MRIKSFTHIFTLVIALCFLASVTLPDFVLGEANESGAEQKLNNLNGISGWRDKSGDLPGLVSGTTLVLIGAAVLGTFLILKSATKRKENKESNSAESSSLRANPKKIENKKSSDSGKFLKNDSNLKVKPYFELNLQRSSSYLSKTSGRKFKVGLAVSL